MEYLDTIVNVIIAILIGVCTILTGAWGYVMREIRDLKQDTGELKDKASGFEEVKKRTENLSEKFYLKDDLKERLDRIEDKQDKIIDIYYKTNNV